MKPQINPQAAKRANELQNELHQLFEENGWPIVMMGFINLGDSIQVIVTNQLDMQKQMLMIIPCGEHGTNLVRMANMIGDTQARKEKRNSIGALLEDLAHAKEAFQPLVASRTSEPIPPTEEPSEALSETEA